MADHPPQSETSGPGREALRVGYLYTVPDRVLLHPETQAALREGDFARVIELIARRGPVAHAVLAEALEISTGRVGDYIAGRLHPKRRGFLERMADGLGIPGHFLGLPTRAWERRRAPGGPTPAEPAPASGDPAPLLSEVSLHGQDRGRGTELIVWDDDSPGVDAGGERVLRRELLGVTAALGVAPAASTSAVSGPVPERIDGRVVERLRRRTARHRRLDDYLSGSETYRLYRSDLDFTLALVGRAPSDGLVREPLVVLLAEQAQQAGWAAFDAGRLAAAGKLFRFSHDAATEVGDRALAGNALALMAYQQSTTGRPAHAVAQAACETAGPDAHPAARALLAERCAWANAAAGRPDQTQRALDAARDALSAGRDEPAPDWAAWVDHDEVEIMTGRCWAELHRPLRAVPALEGALAGFDDRQARDKALYLCWLAAAYLDAGEVEQAASVAGRVFELSEGVASARPRRRLGPVVSDLGAYRDVPAVGRFLDLWSRP